MEPLTLAALGAGAWWLMKSRGGKSFPLQSVKGSVTGKSWLTRVVGIAGSGADKRTVVEVYAPAGSFGPHSQVLVATYEQLGSDKGSRKVISTGTTAIPAMVKAAGQDFGIKK